MKIVILGPPGTGKGTQAKLIARRFKLKHISTGEIFRKEFARKTRIGVRAQKYWGPGNLVPDSITLALIKKNLPKDNFILDGFPRSIKQAKALEKTRRIDKVLNIISGRRIIMKRLLRRAAIEGRKDDTPAIIANRFRVYSRETRPLIAFYRKRIINIDGNRDIKTIFKEIVRRLRNDN